MLPTIFDALVLFTVQTMVTRRESLQGGLRQIMAMVRANNGVTERSRSCGGSTANTVEHPRQEQRRLRQEHPFPQHHHLATWTTTLPGLPRLAWKSDFVQVQPPRRLPFLFAIGSSHILLTHTHSIAYRRAPVAGFRSQQAHLQIEVSLCIGMSLCWAPSKER